MYNNPVRANREARVKGFTIITESFNYVISIHPGLYVTIRRKRDSRVVELPIHNGMQEFLLQYNEALKKHSKYTTVIVSKLKLDDLCFRVLTF